MNMKIHSSWYFVIPALAAMIYGYYIVHKKPYISPVSYIIQHDKLTQPMQNLLKLSYIEYDGTFQDAVKVTQNHWIRPQEAKRWEMDDISYANRREIWDSFEKLHIVQRVEPIYDSAWFFSYKLYDYMIVIGDSYDGMKAKMQYIKNIYEQKVDCGPVIFLVADRQLDPLYEIPAIIEDFQISVEQSPKTELEMVKIVAEKMLPKSMGYYLERKYIVTLCMQENMHPNMKDLLNTWLATNPVAGTCLVISSQPYIAYHHSVFTSYMPKEFMIETVGPATIEFMHPGIYFDTLARLLYQENLRMNIKNNN